MTAGRLEKYETSQQSLGTDAERDSLPRVGLEATRLGETQFRVQQPISEPILAVAAIKDAGLTKIN